MRVPTYEYVCRECHHNFDVVQSFAEDALTVCPSCGGPLRKVFSPAGIIFKGSGYYVNDSRPAPATAAAASGDAASGTSGGEGADAPKSDAPKGDSSTGDTKTDTSKSAADGGGSGSTGGSTGGSGGSGTKGASTSDG